jgi:hypothetical protein
LSSPVTEVIRTLVWLALLSTLVCIGPNWQA